MNTQIGKILILIIILLNCSCSDYNTRTMEEIIGITLKGKIKFEQKPEEQWYFNGNGFRLTIYKIEVEYLQMIIDSSKIQEFKEYDSNISENAFPSTRFGTYIGKSKGYYKTMWVEKESVIRTVLIDSTHSKLIYLYEL